MLLLKLGLACRLDDFDVLDSGELSRCDLDERLDSDVAEELLDRDD